MSLKQIHVLDKIVIKEHRKLKRELKILEIKKNIYNKINEIMSSIVDTYYDIINRFTYDDKRLAYAKKR
jgi:hypothetical protein